MTAQLEPGLILTDIQLSCVRATFTRNDFTDAEDDRGQAFLFERLNKPAIFIEVIHTLSGKIRGNHVHKNCDEALNVVSGKLALYLLCDCRDKHVFKRIMKKGDTVVTHKGVPHALQALEETEIVVLFDKDPREDRDRVQILTF
jgi:quercetin dioxygenase-like cupin family protein